MHIHTHTHIYTYKHVRMCMSYFKSALRNPILIQLLRLHEKKSPDFKKFQRSDPHFKMGTICSPSAIYQTIVLQIRFWSRFFGSQAWLTLSLTDVCNCARMHAHAYSQPHLPPTLLTHVHNTHGTSFKAITLYVPFSYES